MHLAQSTAAAPAQAAPVRVLPARGTLLWLIVLGYAANLIAGFGDHLGSWRPVPIYAFLGIGLLVFQHLLSSKRSFWNGLYINLTSGFALAYAADVVLNTSTHGHFTRNPITYLAINGFLLLAYAGATLRRWWKHPPRQWTSTFGTNFLGFALINLITAGLLQVLSATLHVTVDLAHVWHLTPAGPYHTLAQIEVLIAGGSAIAALALIGSSVVLASAQGQPSPVPGILSEMTSIVSQASRSVLGPLVWISTSLVLATLAQHVTQYYADAAPSQTWFDLFNPVSQFSLLRLDQGVLSLGLGAGAIASTLLSVLLVDQDLTVLRRAWNQVVQDSQVILLSILYFAASLTGLNALQVALGVTHQEPFQLGLVTVLAALALAVYEGVRAVQQHRQHGNATSAAKGKAAITSLSATHAPANPPDATTTAPATLTDATVAATSSASSPTSTAAATTPTVAPAPTPSAPNTGTSASGNSANVATAMPPAPSVVPTPPAPSVVVNSSMASSSPNGPPASANATVAIPSQASAPPVPPVTVAAPSPVAAASVPLVAATPPNVASFPASAPTSFGGRCWLIWEDGNGGIQSAPIAPSQLQATPPVNASYQDQASQPSPSQPVVVIVTSPGASTEGIVSG